MKTHWLEKVALKMHALQTLPDGRASPKRAKRLECVRFIGAFRRGVGRTWERSRPGCELRRRLAASTNTGRNAQ